MNMKLGIYRHGEPHPSIKASLYNVGNVFLVLDIVDKEFDKHKQSWEMILLV